MLRRILYIFIFISFGKAVAQNANEVVMTPAERNAVNQYIIFGNNCNNYLNQVSIALQRFNERINTIHTVVVNNPTTATVAKQKQQYSNRLPTIRFDVESAYNKTIAFKNQLPKQRFLLLEKETEKLKKHIIELQGLYAKIKAQTKTDLFKDTSFKKSYVLLKQASELSNEFIDTNYSFSIASVIFYGKQTALTPLLDYLNKKTASTKDVVLGIRQQNKKNVQTYLTNFLEIENYEFSEQDIIDLSSVGIDSDFKSIKTNYINKFSEAFAKVETIAKDYLNHSVNNDSIHNRTLIKTLNQFNRQNSRNGIAGLYNSLISKSSKYKFKLFVEEPLPFSYKLPKQYKRTITLKAPKKEVVKTNDETESVNVIKRKDSLGAEEFVFQTKHLADVVVKKPQTLKGAKINNLVLLLDVSRSMHREDKLPLLKNSIVDLVNIMRPKDKIAIVVYSGESRVVLHASTISEKEQILEVISKLTSACGTNVTAGLKLAYSEATKSFTNNGNNKIILATDGDFPLTPYLKKMITKHQLQDIDLSVFHYGKEQREIQHTNLQNIAKTGNGNYKHIETNEDATNALILEAKEK